MVSVKGILPAGSLFEIRGITDSFSEGLYPSRIGDPEEKEGRIIIPVIYDPERSVKASLMPIRVGL